MWCNLCGYDNLEQVANNEMEEERYYRPAPRWKMLLRRARRRLTRRQGATAQGFQYDPLSYALNFDERNSSQEQGLLHTSSPSV